MKNKLIIPILLLIAGIFFAVWPLFGKNYIPTHDGEYHIVRIVEFSRMLSAGNLIPRWAPDMNSGYGIPIFNYHYPLPNYIGSFVRIFTNDAVYAFQGSMGLGYILLVVLAYLWLATLFGVIPASVGALVAAFTPYLFVDMYVRGSIGEVWATAFLFLCFYLLEKKKLPWFAISYGLLILSHNIMAMLYTPFLFGYLLIRNKKAVVWMLGGIGISAFFWMPAILESKYVVGLNTVNFREHFIAFYELLVPSWGTEFSGSGNFGNKISFQIGLVQLIAMAGAIYVSRKKLLRYFISFFAVCVLFMLPISAPLWEFAKPLQLVQYPWRLLSFVIPVSALCAAFWVSSMKKKWWGIIIGILAVIFTSSYARPVLYAPRNEMYYMSRSNFIDGTSSMGNSFSTIWTGWINKNVTTSATLKLTYFKPEARIQHASKSGVATHTLYFPGWKAFIDNRETPIFYPDGIIHVTIPAGTHTVSLRFTQTPIQVIADIISIVSMIALVIL